MRVLVIGANGRLGRACVEALHKKEHEVVAFVRNKATFPAELQSNCTATIEGDAVDQAQIEAAIRENACSGLIQAGGYTPMLGTNCNMPSVSKATLYAVETIGRERSQGVTIQPHMRVRVWMPVDLSVMDSPYDDGCLLESYLPPVFPIHRITYPMVMGRSTDSIAWSLICPAQMHPSDHAVRLKKIDFGGPKVPHWNNTCLWIPFIGRYLNAFANAMWQMPTTYEKVANFMADDFSLGLESGLIGKKVAPNRVP